MTFSTQVATASAVRAESITGVHLFKIFGYSLTKGIGIGRCIDSDIFTIGGYDWVIRYYPDGTRNESNSYIGFYLDLKSESNDAGVKVRLMFTILQQNGRPSAMTWTSGLLTFRNATGPCSTSWGNSQFINRTDFEASICLKDDAFTLECTVTVVKGTVLEKTSPCGITIPPSNLNQNLIDLLESGKGTDITFVVNGERFKAHRCVLAARSPVFSAELLGCMKENSTGTITVEDIEAPVFKSMLHFVYSDSLPDFVGTSDDDGEKQDLSLMAQHLVAAADRYQLERLRLICEDLLYKNLCMSNVATTLILAERHNCSQLKVQCLKFMSSPEVFKAVALTDEFQNLMKICPSILKDIKALT